jgi:hypothetical protein
MLSKGEMWLPFLINKLEGLSKIMMTISKNLVAILEKFGNHS